MSTFQSTYRSLDLNFGKKVIEFRNYTFSTSDVAIEEFLRRHSAANPSDVWELPTGLPATPETEAVVEKPKPRSRMIRGKRTVEDAEPKE